MYYFVSYLSSKDQRFQSRNKTSESLRKIAGKGVEAIGVIQVTRNLVVTLGLIVTNREKLVNEELP